jgi:hypothetical protein
MQRFVGILKNGVCFWFSIHLRFASVLELTCYYCILLLVISNDREKSHTVVRTTNKIVVINNIIPFQADEISPLVEMTKVRLGSRGYFN